MQYEGVLAGRVGLASVRAVSLPRPTEPPNLILERLPEAAHEPDSVVDAPLIGFDAFSSKERIFGWVRLSADRLTDLLNAHDRVAVANAQVEHLAHDRITLIDGIILSRPQLFAVRAGGPVGDPSKRQRTRQYPLRVRAGAYQIGGFLHARPDVAPLAEIAERPTMVPLSSAWLEYWRDGHRVGQWVGTILFNRDLADFDPGGRRRGARPGGLIHAIGWVAGRPGARLAGLGAWRSLVAHQSGGLVVVGSNPAAPTNSRS